MPLHGKLTQLLWLLLLLYYLLLLLPGKLYLSLICEIMTNKLTSRCLIFSALLHLHSESKKNMPFDIHSLVGRFTKSFSLESDANLLQNSSHISHQTLSVSPQYLEAKFECSNCVICHCHWWWHEYVGAYARRTWVVFFDLGVKINDTSSDSEATACLARDLWYVRRKGSYTLNVSDGKYDTSFYRAMHFSAKRGIAIACRLSVRPSVCLWRWWIVIT